MLSKSNIQKSIQQRIKANMFEMNKKMQVYISLQGIPHFPIIQS
jgi:hypothetical protein